MPYSVLLTLFSLAMVPGFLGVVLPFLPGIAYMFVVVLLFVYLDRFAHLSPFELSILTGILILSLIIDYLAGIMGAKFGGASKRAMLMGVIGLVVGTILFPPIGSVIGLFLGVLAAELLLHKDERRALKAASGSLIGTFAGIIINLILALAFFVGFVLFAN